MAYCDARLPRLTFCSNRKSDTSNPFIECLITVIQYVQKKDQNVFCNIFYKTKAILVKSAYHFLNKFATK